jgi:hypothetical protein
MADPMTGDQSAMIGAMFAVLGITGPADQEHVIACAIGRRAASAEDDLTAREAGDLLLDLHRTARNAAARARPARPGRDSLGRFTKTGEDEAR